MTSPNRRHLLGLGLGAGTAALLTLSGRGARASVLDYDVADGGTVEALRFRVAPDYRPDLSPGAQRRLTRATLDFLFDAHPPGMELAIWDRNPRDLPQLEAHIAGTVAAVCMGIAANLPAQPVDPVLVIALLYNESRFSPVAISPSGAVGMAQFMPNTALEYALKPVAHLKLWRQYRRLRDAERKRRRRQQDAFLKQYGIRRFASEDVIEHTLESGRLDALAAYRKLTTAEKPEQAALKTYVDSVREELGRYDFFADGEAVLRGRDARTGYAAATAAVNYIARRLAENSGMTSSAVAAFNAGPAAVRDGNPRSVLYGYGDLPAYPETVRYVQRVLVVHSKLRDRLA